MRILDRFLSIAFCVLALFHAFKFRDIEGAILWMLLSIGVSCWGQLQAIAKKLKVD